MPSDTHGTRRAVVAGAAGALAGLAGCSGLADLWPDGDPPPADTTTSPTTGEQNRTGEGAASTLAVQSTPTLSSVVQPAAGLWNTNPKPDADRVVWSRFDTRPSFQNRLANYFAGRAGITSFGGRADPPFRVASAVGPAPRVASALLDDRVDLATVDDGPRADGSNPKGPFGERANEVVRHPVGRAGWVFVVSPGLADAGVDALTPDRIRRVFAGDIDTWQAVGGPDREPFVFLGPDITGTNLPYETFLRQNGYATAGVDARYGQAAEMVTAAANREHAIGVLPARGVHLAHARGVPTLDVLVDGERRGVSDDYPMTATVGFYTHGDPDQRGRAFLDLLTSPFGQRTLVGREVIPRTLPDDW
ncbi:substrate-binding domain-containing protein [Salarchaeum japonicum]|uniref:substrate-binding domain-containing protein n=1 Tax=Salarchaeum japonicum TaxID=555573 RepID=UPI003C721A4A